MTYFRNVVFIAAVCGLLAGVVMTALQAYATVPLILQAETYEGTEPAHDHGPAPDAGVAVAPSVQSHDHSTHDHGDGWAPADGFERTAFNALANIVTGMGFALVLVALSEFAGGIANWRSGLVWGFAGFAVFTLAPGLGLAPELPAMPAADLFARQVWWIGTAAATAAGLALIAFGRSPVLAILAVALMVAPHIIGAPQPTDYETPVPPDLHHRFIVASTVTNLVFWLVLGAAAGYLRSRFSTAEQGARNSFA
ncbi:CbtA family protein [Arvimicrobium flavum]|uniref:CbtA family protein n=1 Tax=Arvimicrobium flavum TaxID=3393320 RepID=UPI00237A7E71|nr:CbtA family protein [Mesorhizobium shangrilense]